MPEGNLYSNIFIKGYDFSNGVDYSKIIESYFTTGFQATHLAKAIEIIKKMREDKCTIFLGYTSNMVSSGLRDIFRFLAENKLIDVIVTTGGGVEEDLIKCIKPFLLGEFTASGKELRESGINRIGNIFVPNDRYAEFEKFFVPLIDKLSKIKESYNPSELIDILGKEINNKESIYYWCHKNNIPVFCPTITDGSIGDMVYFYKYQNDKFKIDIADDIKKINDIAITAKKTGLIILGSGVVKHHICNANMFRNGAEYAVYINNAQEFDGSDAGARPDEAVSWGKILSEAKMVKVFGDATILFPLIVAKAFVKTSLSIENAEKS
ncbi:deoxyhypusine synthase [Candidatus Woesearchaeota archaeon]|nr:deoxyhypusine synthase [Candidatus Woesearchaeota archaeon]